MQDRARCTASGQCEPGQEGGVPCCDSSRELCVGPRVHRVCLSVHLPKARRSPASPTGACTCAPALFTRAPQSTGHLVHASVQGAGVRAHQLCAACTCISCLQPAGKQFCFLSFFKRAGEGREQMTSAWEDQLGAGCCTGGATGTVEVVGEAIPGMQLEGGIPAGSACWAGQVSACGSSK